MKYIPTPKLLTRSLAMASPFSSSSSSEIDNSAIDAIIAEATDLCALEQIAALNTAHLQDASSLPTKLDARFRNLKTFPPAPGPTATTTTTTNNNNHNRHRQVTTKENILVTESPGVSSPSPTQPTANTITEPSADVATVPKPKSTQPPPSPPRRRQTPCCFGFSPRRVDRKRGTNAAGTGSLHLKEGLDDDGIFSEFGSSSMKESRRRLKKAWKEQEKASQEADKMVKWVKQVSARIKEASIHELLDEDFD